MTDNNHPITPPSELVQQWLGNHFGTTVRGEVSDVELAIATQAARWGSDQELEACCEWTWDSDGYYAALALRADRRPKPPSLKELALETFRSMQIEPVVINGINVNADVMGKYNIIRRALESLPD
jgi:hypothetical protein